MFIKNKKAYIQIYLYIYACMYVCVNSASNNPTSKYLCMNWKESHVENQVILNICC